MRGVSVWLVQVSLFELFDYYLPLHFQTARVKVERQHTVTLQPESGFHILTREGDVIIGYVIICPCVVFASGILYRSVIVGHMDGASEHQVLKQMGESGMIRIFIACAHIVQ